MKTKARVIAFYLPQFHPTPENDEWWGKGFTEWTNVGRAKPLFRGHYQPRVPADLGYYDLRMPEIREQQAEMAFNAGIEGFCYWHYWFGNGKMLLSEIFDDVLESGKPDYPFCLGWANLSWTKRSWNGIDYKGKAHLIEQIYPGDEDIVNHFKKVLPAFKDKRYIRIDGKPVFLIYRPLLLPDAKHFMDLWNSLAIENGEKGVFFIGHNRETSDNIDSILDLGFDAVNPEYIERIPIKLLGSKLLMRLQRYIGYHFTSYSPAKRYQYKDVINNWFTDKDKLDNVFPTIIPNWDRSPRGGKSSLIFTGSTPDLFRRHVQEAIEIVQNKPDNRRIIFLKSWNEWAEGNYMEPDLKFGHGYLDALREVVKVF